MYYASNLKNPYEFGLNRHYLTFHPNFSVIIWYRSNGSLFLNSKSSLRVTGPGINGRWVQFCRLEDVAGQRTTVLLAHSVLGSYWFPWPRREKQSWWKVYSLQIDSNQPLWRLLLRLLCMSVSNSCKVLKAFVDVKALNFKTLQLLRTDIHKSPSKKRERGWLLSIWRE